MTKTDSSKGALPPPLPAGPLAKITDFPDFLSPVVVKELRQGLSSNSFLALFLGIQAFLLLMLLISFGVDNSEGDTGKLSSQFQMIIFALAVLVIQPLRGLAALWHEIREKTIDLVLLTRLRSSGIVFGKWSSLMIQSLLIFISFLPFLFFRYFLGGMNVVGELLVIIAALLLSGVITAGTIALSAQRSVILRNILPVFVAPFGASMIIMGLSAGYDDLLNEFTPDGWGWFGWAALIVAFFAYFTYFALEIGIQPIAPSSENRSTRMRLINLGLIVILGLIWLFTSNDEFLPAILIIMVLAAFHVFIEDAVFPSIITQPFVKRGFVGRLFGRFFYPGWATGTLYFFLLLGIIISFGFFASSDWVIHENFFPSLLGSIFFTTILAVLIGKTPQKRLGIVAVVLLVSGVLNSIFSINYSLRETDEFTLVSLSFLPIFQFSAVEWKLDYSLVLFWVIVGLYGTILLILSLCALRKLKLLEKEAQGHEA